MGLPAEDVYFELLEYLKEFRRCLTSGAVDAVPEKITNPVIIKAFNLAKDLDDFLESPEFEEYLP